MPRFCTIALPILGALLLGCGDGDPGTPTLPAPAIDWDRDILETDLALDVTQRTGTATLKLAPSDSSESASFEVEGLTIQSVTGPSGSLRYALDTKAGRLDVALPRGAEGTELHVAYGYAVHDNFDGYLAQGLTFLWPRFCGNLFPCKSIPTDGLRFKMSLTGIPAGKQAVFPAEIPTDAPSYMPAFAISDFVYIDLGKTPAGTKVGAYAWKGEEQAAKDGTKDLAAIFAWYEKTYGAYRFGKDVASVAADWGEGAYGGMEHHPYWHVARDAMNDPVTHAHEAAHGWFGNGVRIRCWEDFVLSEGTVSYLAARATEAVLGSAAGQAVWDDYKKELDASVAKEDTQVWIDGCNQIDLINHPLWSNTTYMKGAFFYRAVAAQIGADKLDAALAKFYQKFGGQAAGVQDMLDTIKAETGYDPTDLAKSWLRSLGAPPT
jgi:hypothetical protein